MFSFDFCTIHNGLMHTVNENMTLNDISYIVVFIQQSEILQIEADTLETVGKASVEDHCRSTLEKCI